MDIYGEFFDLYFLPYLLAEIYADEEVYKSVLKAGTVYENAGEEKLFSEKKDVYEENITNFGGFNGFYGISTDNRTDVVNNIYNSSDEERFFNAENSSGIYKTEENAVYKNIYGKEVGARNETLNIYDTGNAFFADTKTVTADGEAKNFYGGEQSYAAVHGLANKDIYNVQSESITKYGREENIGKTGNYIFDMLNESRKVFSEKSTDKSVKNEFVINLGGITQNITGNYGDTDIGEEIARCIINAINTSKEGAF